MKKTLTALSMFALAFVGFTATAIAAGAVAPDDGSLLDLAKPVYDAVVNGNYWLAAAVGVVFLTAATRKYLPDAYGGKFARGQWGGRATAFIYAFAGALATTFAAPGAAMSMAVLLTAFKVGTAAIGGWMVLHGLAKWLTTTKFWNEKMPAPVKMVVGFILGLMGSNAIKKAEAAGQKAVDENPPQGGAGPTGNVTEI